MEMTHLSASEMLDMEYLFEEFHADPSPKGAASVARFVHYAHDRPWKNKLLLELLHFEFERQIREGLPLGGKSLSRAYAEQLAELADPSLFRAAMAVEFGVRSEIGDVPEIELFLDWLGSDSPADRSALYGELDRIQPMMATIHAEDGSTSLVRLDQPTLFGRQSKTEPPPIHMIDQDGQRRVIVCSNRCVSRQQVFLMRRSAIQLQVDNVGSKLPIYVDNERELLPGESYAAKAISRIEFLKTTLILQAS